MVVNKNFNPQLFYTQLFELDKLYNLTTTGSGKNDVSFEFTELNVLFNYSKYYLNNVLEKRFWIFNDFDVLAQYSFNFQRVDIFQKSLLFDLKKKKRNSLPSYIYVCNRRNNLLEEISHKKKLRARTICLNKCGLNVLIFGFKVPLVPNFSKIHHKLLYSIWFILTLNFIGVLTHFSLYSWKIRLVPNSSKLANRTFFYYKKNIRLESSLYLNKNLISNE